VKRLAGTAAAITAVVAAVAVPAGEARSDPSLATVAVGQPRILIWGNDAFVGEAPFALWLKQHGKTYSGWAAGHPAGRTIVIRSTSPLDLALALPRSVRVPRGSAASRPAPAPSDQRPRRQGSPAELLLFALGAVMITLAAIPLARVAPSLRSTTAYEQQRLVVAAVGATIIVGVAIAELMS
jgi:hypothetical protein